MSSPTIILARLLIDKGVGLLTGTPVLPVWSIKIGRKTETPANQIVLYDTGGSNPNTKFSLDFVHVQALVRGVAEDYPGAYAKARDVKDALLGIDSQDVVVGADTVRVVGITMLADIAFIGYDSNNRPEFTINFRLLQERVPSALSNRDSL